MSRAGCNGKEHVELYVMPWLRQECRVLRLPSGCEKRAVFYVSLLAAKKRAVFYVTLLAVTREPCAASSLWLRKKSRLLRLPPGRNERAVFRIPPRLRRENRGPRLPPGCEERVAFCVSPLAATRESCPPSPRGCDERAVFCVSSLVATREPCSVSPLWLRQESRI